MPGPEFFQTNMGHQFYQGTMPAVARSLKRIADALEKQNELMEQSIQKNQSIEDAVNMLSEQVINVNTLVNQLIHDK